MRLFKPNVDKMLKNRDIDGLLKALDDKDGKIVKSALTGLGQIGDIDTAKQLVSKLSSGWTRGCFPGDIRVWRATRLSANPWHPISNVLITIGGQDIEQELLELLNHPSEEIKDVAIEVMGGLQLLSGLPSICQMLIQESSTAVRKRRCVWALGKMGSEDAIEILKGHVRDRDPFVGIDSIFALEALGDPGIITVAGTLMVLPHLATACAWVLARAKGKEAIPELVSAFKQIASNNYINPSYRRLSLDAVLSSILDAIKYLHDDSAIPLLRDARSEVQSMPDVRGKLDEVIDVLQK